MQKTVGKYDFVWAGWSPRAIRHNPQSLVRIPSSQLTAPVSKSPDRGVMGKADVQRRWPFCVPGPVLAMSCDEGVRGTVSVRHSRATHTHAVTAATPPHFRPKLSPLSPSLAARVMEELRALNRSQPLRASPVGLRGHVRRLAAAKYINLGFCRLSLHDMILATLPPWKSTPLTVDAICR